MLEVHGLSRYFGGLPALDQVSLEVARGSITALIGPNGAGKSTLVNCITGVLAGDSGKVVFDGVSIESMPAHKITGLGIARTFQNLRVFPKMTVLENIMCGLTIKANQSFLAAMLKLPSLVHQERNLQLRAADMLDLFGLQDKSNQQMGMLSYGDKKRVEMARAFVSDPRLVLLDEPVAGLNVEETAEISGLILRMKRTGFTILLIEHDMDLVMTISDTVVVLDSGKCIARGTPEQVRNNPVVLEAYLGKMSVTA